MLPSNKQDRQRQIEAVTPLITLPPDVNIRSWTVEDFAAIQQLSSFEGWPTPTTRPSDALLAWQQAWPTLVATDGRVVIGFLRALTDGAVTTYIAEILVMEAWRGKGIGQGLVDLCHHLCPLTRIDLLATGAADRFYEAHGFHRFQGFRRSFQ